MSESTDASGQASSVDAEFVRRRITEVVLPDGTRVLLRPIVPEDRDLLLDGFRRLSPQSRYRRFMSPVDELTEEQVRFLTKIDYVDHFAWVALDIGAEGTPGIGVARYVRVPGEPEVAEAAVTVVDDYRGAGSAHSSSRPLAPWPSRMGSPVSGATRSRATCRFVRCSRGWLPSRTTRPA